MAISSAMVAGIMAVTSVVTAGVSAYSGIMNAKAQQRSAQQAADMQALSMNIQGETQQMDRRMEAAQLQREQVRAASSQVASAAGMGVNLNSGSLTSIMEATSAAYEADRQQLLRTGNLQRAASTYSSEAMRWSGRQNKPNYWQAGATLMNGFSGALNYGSKAGWWGNS